MSDFGIPYIGREVARRYEALGDCTGELETVIGARLIFIYQK